MLHKTFFLSYTGQLFFFAFSFFFFEITSYLAGSVGGVGGWVGCGWDAGERGGLSKSIIFSVIDMYKA